MSMSTIDRRSFLRGAAALTGGIVIGGPLRAGVSGAAPGPLGPVADLRDGVVRLWLPRGFQYRSFHDTDLPPGEFVVLDDGTLLPGRHDGMAAFPAPSGNVWLVRNHEVNGTGGAFGDASQAYDSAGPGGTTTVQVTPRGQVLSAFTSLNGTQMNCAGGPMPWGSWITCEETVNGPDVGPDFTGVSNVPLTQRHGFIFDVPAGGQSNRQPITAAGRFAHEATAFDPREGILYLTEDNFGFASGLYRYLPPANPMATGGLADDGRLQMLAVDGMPNADLAAAQPHRASYRVHWVDIDDPAPTFPFTPGEVAPTTNDEALTYVGNQGRAQGAALFSRLEGIAHHRGVVYFTSTQGGGPAETGPGPIPGGFGNGFGQVWALYPRARRLELLFESSGRDVLDGPDNVTVSQVGRLVLCEDSSNDNFLRGLNRHGQIFDVALNRLVSSTGSPRFDDEFAGATFDPSGGTLFVNIQASRGMSFAIWGPWRRIGL